MHRHRLPHPPSVGVPCRGHIVSSSPYATGALLPSCSVCIATASPHPSVCPGGVTLCRHHRMPREPSFRRVHILASVLSMHRPPPPAIRRFALVVPHSVPPRIGRPDVPIRGFLRRTASPRPRTRTPQTNDDAHDGRSSCASSSAHPRIGAPTSRSRHPGCGPMRRPTVPNAKRPGCSASGAVECRRSEERQLCHCRCFFLFHVLVRFRF